MKLTNGFHFRWRLWNVNASEIPPACLKKLTCNASSLDNTKIKMHKYLWLPISLKKWGAWRFRHRNNKTGNLLSFLLPFNWEEDTDSVFHFDEPKLQARSKHIVKSCLEVKNFYSNQAFLPCTSNREPAKRGWNKGAISWSSKLVLSRPIYIGKSGSLCVQLQFNEFWWAGCRHLWRSTANKRAHTNAMEGAAAFGEVSAPVFSQRPLHRKCRLQFHSSQIY